MLGFDALSHTIYVQIFKGCFVAACTKITYLGVSSFSRNVIICYWCLQGNAFLQRHQPWVLIKQPEEQPWLDTVLHTALECVRLCCVLLYPIVPQSMTEVRHRLGLLTDITTQDLQCRLNRTFINPGSEHIPGASTKLNSCSKLLFKKFDI